MKTRWSERFVVGMVIASGVVAWLFLAVTGTNTWVFHVTSGVWFRDINGVPPREFAIVPGTGFHDGRPYMPMEERLRLALELYRAGLVKSILVSGNEVAPGWEVSGMRKWLTDRGVSADRVLSDPLGIRTLETMTRAFRVFGIHNAIVCTQSWAAPRAVFLARGSGIDAVALTPEAVAPRRDVLLGTENLKISLAFVERYMLASTQ